MNNINHFNFSLEKLYIPFLKNNINHFNFSLEKLYIPFLTLLFLVISSLNYRGFAQDIYIQDNCTPESVPSTVKSATCSKSSSAYNNKYNRYNIYIPNETTPIKTIKINFNFWQKDDGSGNWQNTTDYIERIEQVGLWLNGFYQYNTPPTDPISGVAFITDSRIRVEIQGIYFYQNSAMWATTNASLLNNTVATIDPTRMDALNIHITGGNFYASGFAIFPNDYNFGSNSYIATFKTSTDPAQDYALANHLAHELGHCLDLEHTYNSATCNQNHPDYLDDVFGTGSGAICHHQAGWSCDPTASDNTCTNNLMGGSSSAGYLSPKQMGRIHRALSLKSVRRYVKECPYSETPLIISSNETWDFNMKMYSDIVVKPGAVLTVKCTLLLPNFANIIVEPGGRLEIDGGLITNGCDKMWYGIQVWGDRTKIQNKTNQGYLIMRNGAQVEYARDAVTLSKRGEGWVKNGGVIQATNSTFRNNGRCVEFMNYKPPTGSDVNKSYFSEVNFISDAVLRDSGYVNSYWRPKGTNVFVTMWQVAGINFTGCTFESTTDFDIDLRSTGIYSEDASYTISAKNWFSSNPVKTTFKNLTMGVYAKVLSGGITKNVKILHSIFDNVQQGITGNTNFGTISSNLFNVPGFSSSPTSIKQWGIYLEGAKGFNISNNVMTGIDDNKNYGVLIKNSEYYGGKISSNEFNGFNWANRTR